MKLFELKPETDAEQLLLARKRPSVRQKDLADLLDITQSHLSNIEAGRYPLFLKLIKKLNTLLERHELKKQSNISQIGVDKKGKIL